MGVETEIKLRVPSAENLESIRQRCLECGMALRADVRILDEYFDTEDEQLRGLDLTVRARALGEVELIAFKGPRTTVQNVYRRIEVEFEVRDLADVRAKLLRDGLVVVASIEKRRSEYVSAKGSVAVDILPFIGGFVEIEAHTSNDVLQLRQALGFDMYEAVTLNYSELLDLEFRRIGRPGRPQLVATFEQERATS